MKRPPRASYPLYLAGKFVKLLFTLIIVAVCALMIWRVAFSGKLPKVMKRTEPNAVLRETLEQNGGELHAFTQPQSTTTKGQNNYGYFSVPRFVIFPEAKQVQIVFRYNNSTLKATAKDFGLAEVPAKGEEVYEVSLSLVVDLTPQDVSDNVDGNENLTQVRIFPTSHTVKTTALYTYFLYTFDGVFLDDVLAVFFDIYYKNGTDVNYESPAYGTLRIYHPESERREVALSGREKKAISEFTP